MAASETVQVRELREDEVRFVVECSPEDMPYKGNCSCIDEETDRETETWIRNELRRGNEWAWCCVRVVAQWKGHEGDAYLGGCSYRSEEEFTQPGGYYDDMRGEALANLNAKLAALGRDLAEIWG